MAGVLEAAQREELHQVADVQARRGRVEAAVERDRPGVERRAQRVEVGARGDQAAPGEVVEDVRSRSVTPESLRIRPTSAPTGLPDGAARVRAIRRDGRLAVEPEPPRRLAPADDADPRAGADRARPAAGRRRGPAAATAGSQASAPLLGPVDAERDGQPGRAAGEVARARRRRGARRASSTPLDHLAGPQQHGGRVPRPAADEVHAPVHAVGEVDVDVPGRPEHDRVARRRPAERVRAGVDARPAYASTSVSRTATSPAARRARSRTRAGRARPRAPGGRRTTARDGAAVADGCDRSAGAPVAHAGWSDRSARADRPSCSRTRAGAVPPRADRGGQRAPHRQHRAHVRRQMRRDRRELRRRRRRTGRSRAPTHHATRRPTASCASRNGTP